MRRRRTELLAGCLTLLVVCQCSAADESSTNSRGKPKPAAGVHFDPVVQKIEGWTVHVDPAMLDGEHKEEGARALGMLANHLQRIAVLMPEDRLRDMQKLEIWIEAVVLHELAHAYHDQILSFDRPDIIKAYKKAESDGTYEEVLLYTGKRVRHYALTDHIEYFAEGTEAYFYRNDFYPFVRAELKEHDPTLHDLLVEIWGPLE